MHLPMTTILLWRLRRRTAVLTTLLILATAISASAAGRSKLDPILELRSQQLAGRSRVIVQFADAPDVRAITAARGIAGRVLAAARAQVAEVDNNALAQLAADPRVASIALDRAAFATVEMTGATTGAGGARQDF